eukprot:1350498-Amorphochlora_amoeboformis.AAC.1
MGSETVRNTKSKSYVRVRVRVRVRARVRVRVRIGLGLGLESGYSACLSPRAIDSAISVGLLCFERPQE